MLTVASCAPSEETNGGAQGGWEDDGGSFDDKALPGGCDDVLMTGEYLVSANKRYRLYLQRDSNLVLSDWTTKKVLWASRSAGKGAQRLTLQANGNLAMYSASNIPVWSTNTAGKGADSLRVADNGALVLFAGTKAVWSVNGTSSFVASAPADSRLCAAGGGDPSDQCPADPNKTLPGQCGCGALEGTCEGYEFTGNAIGHDFSIAFLPDIQTLTLVPEHLARLKELTQWLADNKTRFKLTLVASVGDLVHRNRTAEWTRLKAGLQVLQDKGIPFVPVCGNHDGCDALKWPPAESFDTHFPVSAFTTPNTNTNMHNIFRGSYGGMANAAYEISASPNLKLMLVTTQYADTSNPSVAAAQKVWNQWLGGQLTSSSNRGKPVILVTHDLVPVHATNMVKYDNIFMVMQGHLHGDRPHSTFRSNSGKVIDRFKFAFPWTSGPEQEAAAARIVTFKVSDDGARIERACMRTYSTYHDKWLTNAACSTSASCDFYCWSPSI